MDKKILYAAYGSNINLEQMAYRCPNSTVAGTAMLENLVRILAIRTKRLQD